MTDFDVLYLGYPIWWGMMPMPVLSFLENIDTSDKIIQPFCTHEGSGLGNSLRWLKQSCPKAGLPIVGHDADDSDVLLKQWIGGNTK